MLTSDEIVSALENDLFEFYYQPKVSLVTGKVYGAEALIRLVAPDGMVVMPDQFIPVAEQSSLIKRITRHMFLKLVRDMAALREAGPLTISFNVSVRDFEDDALAKLILETLETTKLPSDLFQLELTETATLEAGDVVKENIMLLVDAGLNMAMDDFGKGYSSLDTLSKWPFSTIKLDQGLIGRMFHSERSLTIVETSIRMAHELGIYVVAEGVETQEQYQRLLETGCTKIQGFWISKPIPLPQYISFVQKDLHWSGMPVGLIHMAIIDHVQWRRKLVSELVKAASYTKDSPHRKKLNTPPLSSKECKLGHWYDGIGRMFQGRKSYMALAQPHHELHEIGRKLVNLIAEGAGLDGIASLLVQLSDCSAEMLNLLHSLEFEGMVDMHAAHSKWMLHELNPLNSFE